MPTVTYDICGEPDSSDAGAYVDMIHHSPLLDVRDHAPSDGSKALALPPAPTNGASFPGPVMTTGAGDFFGVGTGNHDALNTGEGQPNHGAG